jgi:hypothetical protein
VSDLLSHIEQANHNENCAKHLLTQPKAPFRDWAITAAFYCAVHLAEACFSTRNDIGHTDTAPDRGSEEKHHYRSRKIRELASKSAYQSYRKLSEASYHVRYLAMTNKDRQTILEYYGAKEARQLVGSLPEIRAELQSTFGIKLI